MITLTNSHTSNLFLPFRRIANTVARILLNVVTYSPLAVLAALGSISIYAMILYSALNQYRNLFSAPLNLPSLAQTTAIYADGSTHPVNLSISCKGALPPELRARSADALPQQATILIEHMRGFPALVVRSIQDALVEQDRRVCVYDRPGYMLSPQGYAPLPIDALERALGVALAGIGERGPYYLIGHRSGSENAQLFERESRQSVVGMTLLNPTDTALLGLTSGAVDESRRRTAVSAIIGDSVVAENTYSSTALNIQRMLAAIGIRSDSALTDTSTDDQIVTEWALANTHLAQAQYYESLQRQAVIYQLSGTGIAGVYPRKKLPVMLLGLDANETTYRNFLDYVDDRYKVEIPNGGGSQPLLPTTLLARQIIWHIARIN
ncbi:hypothetical protein EV175_005987 [Coemansia sp. RSA 1933]|nr:hypothetical protein EV175_005987 [Coemansia sp. RSA 1933]